MKKKTIKIVILTLLIISVIDLPITAALVGQYSLGIKTNENSTSNKIEKLQLSAANTWPLNGRAISTEKNDQWYPQICSDGAGGAIITWEDERNGLHGDIYAQSVNSTGDVQWTVDGVAICTENDTQGAPQISDDGAGGAIITWNDYRSGLNYDIYAQKINSAGNTIWNVNGTEISIADDDQVIPQISSDQAGGAIITWNDYRSVSNYDIYVQKIDSTGNVKWIANGTDICTESGNQIFPQICSDGAGGAIITWEDSRGLHTDIYAQRIDSTGNVKWTANGVAISTANNTQWYTQLCSDGAGGAIITWVDYRSGTNYDIYAQRIDTTGDVKWTVDGVAISTAVDNQEIPQICSDGAGGAIITWKDYSSGSNYDIYAQRIDSTGDVKWAADGVVICMAKDNQVFPQICSDGAGGAIITWDDSRSEWNDIYAQRIDSAGNVKWMTDGVAICNATFSQRHPQIISGEDEDAIITWLDKRSWVDYDIYAQLIKELPLNGDGDEGFPFGILITVVSIVGGVAIVSIIIVFILKKRRKYEQ